MRFDGVLLTALAALVGGVGAVYPLPALLCLVFAALLLGSRVSRRAGACAVLCCTLGAARGAQKVRHFEATRIQLRDALGPPSRCDLNALVVASPVWSDGSASFVAE